MNIIPTENSPRMFLRAVAVALVVGALAGAASAPATATIPISNIPLFLPQEVPGNLVLTPSVEWPTISVAAYKDSDNFSAGGQYTGLFDARFCYAYRWSADEKERHFDPVEIADAQGACSHRSRWSGKFLNWATTQAIEPFRIALTGGLRVKDEPGETWIEKAWHDGQGGTAQFPNFSTNNQDIVKRYTPATWSKLNMRIEGLGNKMRFSRSGNLYGSATAYNPDDSKHVDSLQKKESSDVYELSIRVRVCKQGFVSDNCVKYDDGFKPEGLIQEYSSRLRYSVFGYLNDHSNHRDGAALRAAQKFVGPKRYPAMQNPVTNPEAEWDALTGVLHRNPNLADANATKVVGINDSGVINYINKFGQMPEEAGGSIIKDHKSLDPVSEMYYAALRYLRNVGNVPEYTDNLTYALADGFPVITEWTDPIVYSCQANVILGIGDVFTHRDRNLPGATARSGEGAMPALVAADTAINVETLTQRVAALEEITIPANGEFTGRYNSAYIAGLAYDARVRDQRSDLLGRQTVATYWMDVAEYTGNTYLQPRARNQYWLAAKYGGFTVPDDYDPQTHSAPFPQSWWTDGDRLPQSNDLRPRNFFLAQNPDAMISGLQQAFARIVREPRPGAGAALGTTSAQLEAGNRLYQARFTSEQWTGELNAHDIDPETGAIDPTPKWRASTLLNEMDWKKRKIYTSGSGDARVDFNSANTSLPADLVKYLSGDRTDEGDAVGEMRRRVSILGDIIHSQPVYVPSTDTHTRPNMIYVGANDGMLHGFNADTGEEVFAFVPKAVRKNFEGLERYARNSELPYEHQYFVDGEIAVAEVGNRTMLVATTGRGKPGVFALDVSNPKNIDVFWDKDGSEIPELGNSLGKPVIAQVSENRWSAVLGNGPNSSSGQAALVMISLHGTGPTRVVKLSDGGTNNGLSAPVVWRSQADGYFNTAYAGDLSGRLWKISDLEKNNPKAEALFNAQRPISIAPQVARRPNSGGETWVFFGTGRYLNTGDVGSTEVESWYGIKDGEAIPSRTELLERKILAEDKTADGRPVRALPAGTMQDVGTKKGWYIDLVPPGAGAEGERVVTPMIFQGLALVATTLIPNATDPCGAGARSWVMAIDPFTGARYGTDSYFDANADGDFNDQDGLIVDGEFVPNSGIGIESGAAGSTSVGQHLFVQRLDGQTEHLQTNRATGDPDRVSWRELLLGMGD